MFKSTCRTHSPVYLRASGSIHEHNAPSRFICQRGAERVDPLERPGAECLMVFDSVQMDSHTVHRRSFTSFSATDEMNNK